MQTHYWEEAKGLVGRVSKGLTDLKPSAYKAAAGEHLSIFVCRRPRRARWRRLHEYQPDFVAEFANVIYMLEP